MKKTLFLVALMFASLTGFSKNVPGVKPELGERVETFIDSCKVKKSRVTVIKDFNDEGYVEYTCIRIPGRFAKRLSKNVRDLKEDLDIVGLSSDKKKMAMTTSSLIIDYPCSLLIVPANLSRIRTNRIEYYRYVTKDDIDNGKLKDSDMSFTLPVVPLHALR
jgi:hypothetical protein